MVDVIGAAYRPEELTFVRDFATKAAAQIANINPLAEHIRIAGTSTVGDGGDGLYKRVSSEPSHANKLQSGDGAWWELVEPTESALLNSLGISTAMLENRSKFSLIEDFYGVWVITDAGPAALWSSTAGAGTANELATTVANSINGEVTLKSASDDGTHAENGSALTGANLAFLAEKGGLVLEARLKLDAITDVALFVGFTDVISTTVELPIYMTNVEDADVAASDATDACGVLFDTDGFTAEWCHGGVADGTDVTPAFSGSAPVADTYVTIRVEVSAAGAVQGFIDGVAIGPAIAAAVTPDVALTPVIIIANRGAAQRVATIDYIALEQAR